MDRDAVRRLVENSLSYRKRLEHRRVCRGWGAGAPCPQCGYGLTEFGTDLLVEFGVRGKR